MVHVKLKGQATDADLAKLRDLHRQLCDLTVGFNPSAPNILPLMASIWVVKKCIRQWSGEEIDLPLR